MSAAAIGAVTIPPHPFFDFNDAPDRIERRYDKDDLRNRLLDQLEAVLMYLFPRGKRQGTRFVVGNVHGDAGDSLVIELEGPKRGVWIDFATGESGDVLALWAAVRGFALPRDFGELLDDVGDWLVVPTSIIPAPAKPSAAHDTLGPHTAKWDYHSADGELLACVYRYDTPAGKQYRPWDVASRQTRMPDPRPLYHLPAVAKADTVVLVEGEKCADALMQLGIVATTAMGGAATALAKTDWSPLAGKTVIVWPDHDEAGAKYVNAVIPKLLNIGAKVRRISVPDDKPRRPFEIAQWRARERFTGDPQPRRWLIEGVFPLAQAALVAAGGGVGKSFLLLALAREVAAFDGVWANAPTLFGGALAGQGVAIYVTAEDDAIEVHNRLNALGPIPDRLYVLPLPDAGGAIPLFAPDPATRGPSTTPA
jgi:5S rRNA maturation endonuclease (ribonuclease M5)